MLTIVAGLVAVALAGAMSTVPASAAILILLSPNPRRGALPFLMGSVAGSIVVVGLSAVGLHFLPARPDLDQDVWPAVLGLLIGAFLVGYAVYLFGHRSQRDGPVLGNVKTRLRSARPWKFVALGLGLNLRPKAILLAVTAGALINVHELPLLQGTLFVLAYAAAAQSAVVVPIAVWMHSPERAEVALTALDAWLQRNGGTIAAITVLAIGVFVACYSVFQL
ncbi:MAG: hypothetical protein JWO49_2439 [Arthrobacter sp.]|nr:hypothetical protein [Arthrobacter sp.]MCU1548699.1 hypothetical protein [Arthrobacter sp.]